MACEKCRECGFRHTNRFGLYLMVFFILLASCDTQTSVQRLRNECRIPASGEAAK